MGSHFEKRIFMVLLFVLLPLGKADAAEDLVIRGDHSKPLLSEVPLPMKSLPDWFFESPQKDDGVQLRELLADVDFFTREPGSLGTSGDTTSPIKDEKSQKPMSTAADGATP